MQFIIHKDAGNESLILDGEAYHHLFHSRRTKKQNHCNYEILGIIIATLTALLIWAKNMPP